LDKAAKVAELSVYKLTSWLLLQIILIIIICFICFIIPPTIIPSQFQVVCSQNFEQTNGFLEGKLALEAQHDPSIWRQREKQDDGALWLLRSDRKSRSIIIIIIIITKPVTEDKVPIVHTLHMCRKLSIHQLNKLTEQY
jgi:hypothetical protein